MTSLILSAVMRRSRRCLNASYLILVSQWSKSEVWDEAPRPSIASIPGCYRWGDHLLRLFYQFSSLLLLTTCSVFNLFYDDLDLFLTWFWHLQTDYNVIDSAVEVSSALRCTHYDAFRFFHPSAQPMNSVSMLTRDFQQENEQPGMPVRTLDICFFVCLGIQGSIRTRIRLM